MLPRRIEVWKMTAVLLLSVAISSCSSIQQTPASTPLPPTAMPQPTSCVSVEGPCVELTFDGGSCTFDGPSELLPGLLTFIFHNGSDDYASSNLMMLNEGKTAEGLTNYFWEEPSPNHQPDWATNIPGSWQEISGGEAHFWEGTLEPGIYTTACVHTTPWPEPIEVWLGPIWTIET